MRCNHEDHCKDGQTFTLRVRELTVMEVRCLKVGVREAVGSSESLGQLNS